MLLTIITPYYKTLEYTKKLAKVLVPQLTDEVEWIIVDDGCNEKELDDLGATVYHLKNNSGNASIPRNTGINFSKGEYITFIDSDDMVSKDYIERIINKIRETNFDYCYLSWKTQDSEQIIKDVPPEWNTCVWNCVYKKSIIGNNRFDPKCNLGEDKKFNEEVRKGKKENIQEIIYYYNWKRPNSLSTCYREGKIPFTRE